MARSKDSGNRLGATRRGQHPGDGIQDVYKEMLQDALYSSPPPDDAEERPVKRRKAFGGNTAHAGTENVRGPSAPASDAEDTTQLARSWETPQLRREQIAYNSSDDSAESDFGWEEVDLAQATVQEIPSGNENLDRLDLVLGDNKDTKSRQIIPRKRKPATAAERKLRLEIHKMHVLCLLAHVHLRNHWCNDERVHQSLRSLLSKKNVLYLNPEENLSQFQRTRSFVNGLTQAGEAFRLHFKVTARGISRSYWAESADGLAETNIPKDLDLPIQKDDFRDAAEKREASRDVGAQLFCALLRSVGVDARLVCSLQPLPFSGSAKGKPATPAKAPVYVAAAQNNAEHTVVSETEKTPKQDKPASGIGTLGGRSRFASGPSLDRGQQLARGADSSSGVQPPGYVPMRPKRIVESPYPIYWIEAFDEAAQKWICLDPLVTHTVGKPTKIEPPFSDQDNNMSYVIAFEDDGSARDVTRRYSKAYNAKTRRTRLESTHQGAKWLKRVLRLYERTHDLDRDQLEDNEFARKEAQESLPENVQDFKNHPYYALERHLRRNEVIHPKRESGKVLTGRAGNVKGSEPIYRRSDVHIVKSADSWYRVGREIKPREQPLKRVAARRKPHAEFNNQNSDESDNENAGTALYAMHQTTEYQPPPVVNGRVPKNVYGNLDIYVRSMVPPGGAHVMHAECARAARLLGVDYADAVTGFSFKGRQGTAIVNGAVVASEYAPAVQEVINGFANERFQEAEARRSWEALRMWRRFIAGLRIRERIEGYSVEGENDAPQNAVIEDQSLAYEAGGFFPTGDEEDIAEPTVKAIAPQHEDDFVGGGFFGDNPSKGQLSGDKMDQATKNTVFPEDYSHHRRADMTAHEFGVSSHDSHWQAPTIEIVYGKTPGKSDHKLEHAQAGGFLDEEYPAGQAESPPREADKDLTPFDLADEDLVQARILQQAYEMQRPASPLKDYNAVTKHSDPPGNPHTISTTPTGSAFSQPNVIEKQARAEGTQSQRAEGTILQNEESEDDRGSLLSEDPDDEDADPEWLV